MWIYNHSNPRKAPYCQTPDPDQQRMLALHMIFFFFFFSPNNCKPFVYIYISYSCMAFSRRKTSSQSMSHCNVNWESWQCHTLHCTQQHCTLPIECVQCKLHIFQSALLHFSRAFFFGFHYSPALHFTTFQYSTVQYSEYRESAWAVVESLSSFPLSEHLRSVNCTLYTVHKVQTRM